MPNDYPCNGSTLQANGSGNENHPTFEDVDIVYSV